MINKNTTLIYDLGINNKFKTFYSVLDTIYIYLL